MILDIVNNKNFIKGRWVSSPSTLFVYNPANRDLVGHVPSLNEAMIASAIDAACEAQKSWKDTDATYRSELLMNLYQLILDNREELAELVVLENFVMFLIHL
jgi:succinate-semialdehyde dehydrogenase/glutarate-semialdehyde dehydrogenase